MDLPQEDLALSGCLSVSPFTLACGPSAMKPDDFPSWTFCAFVCQGAGLKVWGAQCEVQTLGSSGGSPESRAHSRLCAAMGLGFVGGVSQPVLLLRPGLFPSAPWGPAAQLVKVLRVLHSEVVYV